MQRSPHGSSLLQVEHAQLSDSGNVRPGNEDYLGCALPVSPEEARTRGWLFALADGVGGQERGEVASQTVVDTLVTGFRNARKHESHASILTDLIVNANTCVYAMGRNAPPRGAMATTVVACALRFDRLTVAHVGDSRCYVIRHGKVKLLTRDHTVANEQQRLGFASGNGNRHLLSRSVGNDLFVKVDCSEHLLVGGDVLLLCSDGFHASVKPGDMAQVITAEAPLDSCAHKLVAMAKERDGTDNISAQLIRVQTVERVGMYRGRPYKLR